MLESIEPAYSSTPSNRQSTTALALIALLPGYDAARLLIDTYFDRVHWFTLVFFQTDFRQRFEELYGGQKRPTNRTTDAFLALVSTVVAMGAQYVGNHRRRLLKGYRVDPDALRHDIFAALKQNLLDIVSLGTLEAAQTCVLMASYYVFQGQSGLAWPICGCALRLALALNLHRASSDASYSDTHADETKKRCWWALFELETFCCMLYGYSSTIPRSECNVDRLDLYHEDPAHPRDWSCALLAYKYNMSKLSTLTQYTLEELYSSHAKSEKWE